MTTTISDSSPPSEDEPSAVAAPARPTAPKSTRATPWRAIGLLARRVHFIAGLLIAPFLVLLCLTGIAYVFSPQINDVLYSQQLFAEQSTGTAHPLSEQVGAALAAYPQDKLNSVVLPDDPSRTTQVVLSEAGLPSNGPFDTQMRTVYVDPYTGKVRGALITDSGRPPAQQWLRTFHANLNLGSWGQVYAEFVASWLPWIVLGGLVLWFQQRRRKRAVRSLLLPPSGLPKGRPRLRGLHGALGLWLAAGLLAVSITGLTWSTYAGANFTTAIDALHGTSPSLTAPKVMAPAGAWPIGLDRALAVARQQGMSGQLTVTPPASPSKPYKINESYQTLPVRVDSVAVDPYSGKVTGRVTWADYPLLAKLTSLGIQAHTGTLLGLPNEIAMALLALGILTMIVLGYRMWWKRRPSGGRRAPAPPPVWRKMPVPVLLALIVVAAVVGRFLPVFGITLVLFVLTDTVLNAVKRRRAAIAV
ncbi:MAG TPA: PepSY domain-containing protein [Pseudonocardiaceae bacterium]|jgi:uncharacterized iron-regulated membrane protein|nr:PepSY domain-containing protein [Pseudonocardiaceae bacterium]